MENDNISQETPTSGEGGFFTKELLKRVLTGVVLLALLPVLVMNGHFIWGVGMIIIGFLACREWWDMSGQFHHSVTTMGGIYIALSIASAIDLHHAPHGVMLVLFVIACVVAMDTAAYFGGKRLGKHKLAPRISPKKTIEGLGCGALASILVGVMFASSFNGLLEISWLHTMVMAGALGLIAQAGDLLVSFVKRKAGVKDSGTLLPGHGGVLDRIDGHLAAFLAFYVMTNI
jgi:phosphatidate cytidylyltransferase